MGEANELRARGPAFNPTLICSECVRKKERARRTQPLVEGSGPFQSASVFLEAFFLCSASRTPPSELRESSRFLDVLSTFTLDPVSRV